MACSGTDVPPVAMQVCAEVVSLFRLVKELDDHSAPHRVTGHALGGEKNELLALLRLIKRKLLGDEPFADELDKVEVLVSPLAALACLTSFELTVRTSTAHMFQRVSLERRYDQANQHSLAHGGVSRGERRAGRLAFDSVFEPVARR